MLTPCNDDDLWLVVDSEQLQVAIKTDESFGAITVGWVPTKLGPSKRGEGLVMLCAICDDEAHVLSRPVKYVIIGYWI